MFLLSYRRLTVFSKLRILIADDEPITRMDLREILEKIGYDIVGEASDGFDAIELSRALRPDLVLMDIKMPLLNGISAAKCIMDERLSDAVVLVTAYSDDEYIEKAKNCSVGAYIVKPIDEKILIANIELAANKGREELKMLRNYQEMEEKLESRKLIERAKALIMNSHSISEQEAFDHIRSISKKKNMSMKKVAQIILKG